MVALVERTLRDFDLSPDDLGLEIIETTILQESDLVNSNLRELHEMGLGLALDDFSRFLEMEKDE